MGSCASQTAGDRQGHSQEIDQSLEQERKMAALKRYVLTIGAGDTGKSTIITQLSLIYNRQFNHPERTKFIGMLWDNTIESMFILLDEANKANLDVDPEDVDKSKVIHDLGMAHKSRAPQKLTVEHATLIQALWQTKRIQDIYANRHAFWLLDQASYYFTHAVRFAQFDEESVHQDKWPNDQDIIAARSKTTGLKYTDIKQPPHTFTFVDVGGQRNERKKWIECFEHVSMILFVVDAAGFFKVLYEDTDINNIVESLDVFEHLITNFEMFQRIPVRLVFNKMDVLRKQLAHGMAVAATFNQRIEAQATKRAANNMRSIPRFEREENEQEFCRYLYEQFETRMTKDVQWSLQEPLCISACDQTDVKQLFEYASKQVLTMPPPMPRSKTGVSRHGHASTTDSSDGKERTVRVIRGAGQTSLRTVTSVPSPTSPTSPHLRGEHI